MMITRYLKATVASAVLLVSSFAGLAQSMNGAHYETFFEYLPTPLPSMEQTATSFDKNAIEKIFRKANNEINSQLAVAYAPLSGQLAANLEEAKSNKLALARFSPEEQKLIEVYRNGSAGLSPEAKSAYFGLVMQSRPLLSSGKLSWAPKLKEVPAAEAAWYQQILLLEKRFDWGAFSEQASKTYYSFGDKEPELEAIHTQFDTDFKKLPKIKVKIMEGSFIDMEDPGKAITLWEQYGIRTNNYFKAKYAQSYKAWKEKYDVLRQFSAELEKFSAAAAGKGLTKEKNKIIFLALADLQARLGESLKALSLSTNRLLNDALVGSINKKQSEEMIAMYVGYKENNR